MITLNEMEKFVRKVFRDYGLEFVMVQPDTKTKFRVVIDEYAPYTRQEIWNIWEKSIAGTKFEGIPLYM